MILSINYSNVLDQKQQGFILLTILAKLPFCKITRFLYLLRRMKPKIISRYCLQPMLRQYSQFKGIVSVISSNIYVYSLKSLGSLYKMNTSTNAHCELLDTKTSIANVSALLVLYMLVI